MPVEFLKPDFEFFDDRGSLIQLVHEGWKQVNYITSKAGAFRGNHYHKNNVEAFFIISGELKLGLKDSRGNAEEYHIKAGDFFKIFPNTNHSFDFITDTTLISLYDKGVEEDGGVKDIYCDPVT